MTKDRISEMLLVHRRSDGDELQVLCRKSGDIYRVLEENRNKRFHQASLFSADPASGKEGILFLMMNLQLILLGKSPV